MIRVLVVDDDKLVRKGLVSSMPWNAFGMEVVGEANNGDNALKFMESNKVDLLMTDLAMPVMSGIELMRIVRGKYPDVQIVVLTLHQDFEYVQEALRLGAIDYIAKIQLEREQFEEVLGRIIALMEQKDGLKGAGVAHDNWETTDGLFVCYSLHPNNEASRAEQGLPDQAMEAETGIWYWADSGPADFPLNPNYALVRFRGLKEMDRKSVMQMIKAYRKIDLFYDYHPSQPCLERNAEDISQQDNTESSLAIDRIKEQWGSADWIYEISVFDRLLRELQALRLPPIRMARIFYSLSDEWNRLYEPILPEPILIEDFFPSWYRFEEWLTKVRDGIRQANTKPLFSEEIQYSIVKAMNLAKQRISEPISAADIALMVNMSGSYFSQCFKQYVGQTYTDYVRDIRMERAKEYLKSTTKTIQWIAEQIGYNDEKYFSRLFREHVGLLPSEYRNTAGQK
ncbi:response regulator [Cohnella herbarum]|uniref:Response regulator n=1 Tax=Cohnella herbarum TaxID=2728023 RepID=A0A7Z2VPP5_9BACL|nr:response regulator [Cohnella herbarum]QJD86881.1 response regulator [Cohnella herbarum]